MSTFRQAVVADLDEHDVDSILVTAFDGQYGGCWYWVNEEDDVVSVDRMFGLPDPVLEGSRLWTGVRLRLAVQTVESWRDEVRRTDGRSVVVDKAALDWAWGQVLSRYGHTETARQLNASMLSGDLDVDAEGADVLVQVALFGDIIYG